MPCKVVKTGERTAAIVCTRGGSKRCSSCKTRAASKLCDFPVTRDGKETTCDRPLCTRCAVTVGPDRDHCPAHARYEAKQAAESRKGG